MVWTCTLCGLDIEAPAPYDVGTWRDRGGNVTCSGIDQRVLMHVATAYAGETTEQRDNTRAYLRFAAKVQK